MAQTTVSGQAHIKFIRQGDSISTILIATKALMQFVNDDTGAVNPDWTVASNQPTVYPRIVSQLTGTVVTSASNPVWKVDGTTLSFGSNNKTTDGSYESTSYSIGGGSVPALKICKNVMKDATQNKLISFSCTVATGGITSNITADITITRGESAGEVYTGYISATNGGVVDDTNPSTTLTATLLKGGETVSTGVSYAWYYNTPSDTDAERDNWQPVSGTSKSLTVSRDDIDTVKTYKCDFTVSGSVVTSAFFDVRDDSDPLYIIPNPNQREEVLSSYQQSITYTPLVRRRGQSSNESGWSFQYVLSNVKGSTVRTASGNSITVQYPEILEEGCDLDLFITATK